MKKVLLLLPLLLLLPSTAKAGACSISTLETYIAPGFSCTIIDKTFSGFGYSSTGSGGAGIVSASGVDVIPCPGASPFCAGIPVGEEGFIFTAAWSGISNQTQDSAITYTVTTSQAVVDALSLFAGFGATGTGIVSVGETLSNGGVLALSDPPGSPFSASLTFAPVSSLTVVKDISIAGGTDGTAFVSVVGNAFSQTTVPPVPEPASMLLFGSGLVAIGGFIRSRQRKQA